MSFTVRRKKLRDLIHAAKADALLVTNFINVTYLTGFTGDDSYLLVTWTAKRSIPILDIQRSLKRNALVCRLRFASPASRC